MRHILSSILAVVSVVALAGCVVDAEPESVDEASQSVVKPCGGDGGLVTRTQGFWANHTCVLKGDATGYSLVPISLGTGSLDKAAAVENYLKTPPKGDAQIIMGHQLVAAKLNVNAFDIGNIPFADFDGDGALETVADLISIADGLYVSGSSADRIKMGTVLDKLNNAGDAEPTWFDPTCKSNVVSCE